MRSFKSLSEQEILALAISLEEEEDARIYDDFAEGLKDVYPATAKILKGMRVEETGTGSGSLNSTARNSASIFP